MPEVASVPESATENGCLYQPPESGWREGLAAVTCGAVASLRMGTIVVSGGPPNDTLQLTGVPSTGVSAEIVVKLQS